MNQLWIWSGLTAGYLGNYWLNDVPIGPAEYYVSYMQGVALFTHWAMERIWE